MSNKAKQETFHGHFGSDPYEMASMWSDLCETTIEGARLDPDEKSEEGFKRFIIAHYFLWTYPKNMHLVSGLFDVSLRSLQGDNLWRWPKKIAALKEAKIVWHERFNDPSNEIFAFSMDGVDCHSRDKKHPTFNQDTQMASYKFNKPAWRYLILMAINEPKVLLIDGPHKGGKHEMTIFRQGELKGKLKSIPEKLTVGDSGCRTSEPDEIDLIAIPSSLDSQNLAKFKSRARCRHESWNGRIKFFYVLEQRFRHPMANHKIAFEAVAVIVQYQMDCGSPIFNM